MEGIRPIKPNPLFLFLFSSPITIMVKTESNQTALVSGALITLGTRILEESQDGTTAETIGGRDADRKNLAQLVAALLHRKLLEKRRV